MVSPQQLALIKRVQSVLQCNYQALPVCPAHRVLDVDENRESRAGIKEGRSQIEALYFDLVVTDRDTLKPVCVFRMDPNSHLSQEHYNEGTRNLIEATRAAKLPMFVVPIIEEYDHFKIVSHLKTVIPAECLIDKKGDYLKTRAERKRQAEIDAESVEFDNCPWKRGGGVKLR